MTPDVYHLTQNDRFKGFSEKYALKPDAEVMIDILTKNPEPSPRQFSAPEIKLWSAILDSVLDDVFIVRGL